MFSGRKEHTVKKEMADRGSTAVSRWRKRWNDNAHWDEGVSSPGMGEDNPWGGPFRAESTVYINIYIIFPVYGKQVGGHVTENLRKDVGGIGHKDNFTLRKRNFKKR